MEDTLLLTLKKQPFDLMVKGIKQLEFRRPSKWIASRLVGKKYKYVKFTNGYGSDKPWFIAEFIDSSVASMFQRMAYNNGLVVWVIPGDYIIALGEVVLSGNLTQNAA